MLFIKSIPKNASRTAIALVVLLFCIFAVSYWAFFSSKVVPKSVSSKETSRMLYNTWITQYSAALRMALIRAVIGGIEIGELRFNSPSEFRYLKSNSHGVFHPDGINFEYSLPAAEHIQINVKPKWYFNGEFSIEGMGTDKTELMAFFIGLDDNSCKLINKTTEEFADANGISPVRGVPVLTKDQSQYYTQNMIDMSTKSYFLSEKVGVRLASPELKSSVMGCFRDFANKKNIYFFVLLER